MLGIVEIDADERMVATVVFDLDDIDAAFAELDARYLAGEAAAYAHTWSVVRRPTPRSTGANSRDDAGWVNIDHRRRARSSPSDLTAYLRAAWDLDAGPPHLRRGCASAERPRSGRHPCVHGTSQEGFDAEWRLIELLTVDGDLINRCEMFDEADLDAALARFDKLSRPAPRLENAASRVTERFQACFAARDWDAMAETLADDVSVDDRRRVVNAGLRHGRDALIAKMRATRRPRGQERRRQTSSRPAGSASSSIVPDTRAATSRPRRSTSMSLDIVEIDADERIMAFVTFDLDDIDAAFEELDARYLAGEAAAHSHTWSVIVAGYAALNRHEFPPATPDWVNIDHRRGTAFAPGDMTAHLRATWDLSPEVSINIEAVHRLSNLGAVVTHAAAWRPRKRASMPSGG